MWKLNLCVWKLENWNLLHLTSHFWSIACLPAQKQKRKREKIMRNYRFFPFIFYIVPFVCQFNVWVRLGWCSADLSGSALDVIETYMRRFFLSRSKAFAIIIIIIIIIVSIRTHIKSHNLDEGKTKKKCRKSSVFVGLCIREKALSVFCSHFLLHFFAM